MKRLFVVAVMLLFATSVVSAQKSNRTYVDASTLTIINKMHDAGKPFARLDVERYSSLTRNATGAFRQSTGLAVVFKTNSCNIYARWSVEPRKFVANCNDIHSRGLDIYIRHKGKWTFAGVAKPTPRPDVLDFESSLVRRMEEGEKECMVYLPAYAKVKSLEIGVDKGATITPIPSPFKHKVVFIGSSLTHGEANPRPSMIYVAQIGRHLNIETPNLGHSGQCKMQQHFVDIVCDNEADAFVFDAFSNSSAEIINERLYDFVKQIRAKHKDTPLIFLQTEKRANALFDLGKKKFNDDQRAAAEKLMKVVCKDFKNVYFINPAFEIGDDNEGTVDGAHLNALGLQRALKVIEPKLKKILSRHGIK